MAIIYNEGCLACHTYCDTGHRFTLIRQGPLILTHFAERLAVILVLSLPVLMTWVFRDLQGIEP